VKNILCLFLVITNICSCGSNQHDGSFSKSSIQTVDMGKFKGLRIIEIASLNFLESMDKIANEQLFTKIDQENLSRSIVDSFSKSDIEVVPSAQTKVHLEFTEFVLLQEEKNRVFKMTATVAVSRNGIVTRKIIEINGKEKRTLGRTKDNGVKIFILGLADLLREQSSFKR